MPHYTGRGIDQVLPHPWSPVLHESYVESALDYVRLAERANGPVPRPVDFAYVWGAALDEWRRAQPHARIFNLETSITRSEVFEPKGINYRMSSRKRRLPHRGGRRVLANNHVLDWGPAGLIDTLNVLCRLRIKTADAGRDLAQAKAPAILEIPGEGRLLIFSFACETSGAPRRWAADEKRAGINFLSNPPPDRAALASMA